MEIEINGLKYQRIESSSSQPKKYSKAFTMIYGMALMFGGQGSVGTSRKERETPNVNIVEEFKLIQEKKSKLSRKDREWVIFQFNRNFKLITNP